MRPALLLCLVLLPGFVHAESAPAEEAPTKAKKGGKRRRAALREHLAEGNAEFFRSLRLGESAHAGGGTSTTAEIYARPLPKREPKGPGFWLELGELIGYGIGGGRRPELEAMIGRIDLSRCAAHLEPTDFEGEPHWQLDLLIAPDGAVASQRRLPVDGYHRLDGCVEDVVGKTRFPPPTGPRPRVAVLVKVLK